MPDSSKLWSLIKQTDKHERMMFVG